MKEKKTQTNLRHSLLLNGVKCMRTHFHEKYSLPGQQTTDPHSTDRIVRDFSFLFQQ